MGVSLEAGALLHKRYRIVEILGQGGMGSVYRSVDENLGVDVAVKENLFTTDEYARQFRLEAVILANLRHPNLPRVTDHFVIGEQGQYLIMDYIEGEDLRQRMERTGTIGEEEAILIGAAMCEALQYLHTRKPSIIHRDVKPGNVRIAPDGHIFLVDFGLAKLVKGSQATTTGARAMTPGYSPPEQYGTARTDPRTDIYSLGATLYAALSGIIPEDGLARAMDNVQLTPLRQRNPKVSRRLAAAIEKAMGVRPEDRYQSAEEFKQALLASSARTQRLEGEILVEPPPPEAGKRSPQAPVHEILHAAELEPASRPSKPRRRNWSTGCWVSFSFFLLTILAGVLAVIAFWTPIAATLQELFATATSEVSPAVPTATEADALPSPVEQTATPSLAAAPSHTSEPSYTPSITPTPTETPLPTATMTGGGFGEIAFVSNRTGVPQIFLMDADGSNPHQITDLPDGACQPDWSPDGSQLVFISPCLEHQDQYPQARLYITNADGSGLAEVPGTQEGDFDPAWSPDGIRIAFASRRDGTLQIHVVNLLDETVNQLTFRTSNTRLPDWSRQPAWTPLGTQITYTGHYLPTGTLQIWIMSDAGRGSTLLVRSGSLFWDSQPDWSPDGARLVFSQGAGQQALGWLMTFDPEDHQSADATKLRDYGTNAEISPDGLWIVYESIDIQSPGRSDFDIFRLSLDGLAFSRLTSNPAMDFDPVWRPIAAP